MVKLPWYTEGPVMDRDGSIFFTTLKGKLILKIDSTGKISEWAKAENPNGQIILPSGDHLICDNGVPGISRYDSEGNLKGYDIKNKCSGEEVSSPNDLVMDTEGGIYFTDSVREKGKVCYYKPGGTEKIIARDLDFPNGIAISNNGSTLLVAESYKNRILSFDIHAGFKKGIFADLPVHPSGEIIKNLPDGIKVDNEGNLWVAHYGMSCVQVLSPKGKVINSIPVDFPLTSNLFLAENNLIVTGGFDEPGPGGLLQVSI